MSSLTNLLYRIQFKLLRLFPFSTNSLVSIKSGPLKGYKFCVGTGNRFLFGTYEEDALKEFLSKIKEDDVIYDLGANAGYHSLAMAQKTKNVIYAFEPFPLNVFRLKKHLKTNKVGNVVVKEMAVSDKPGIIEFSNTPKLGGNTYITQSKNFKDTQNVLKVNTTCIDKLVYGENPINPPQIMKIDVEGAEYDVLKGAEKTLKEHRPLLLLATHDMHLPGVKDKCLNFLKSLEYKIEATEEVKGVNHNIEDFIAYPN